MAPYAPRQRPSAWIRAAQVSFSPFAIVYLGVACLLWGDGSVLAPRGDALSGLGRWLCFGWLPAAAVAMASLAWNAHRGGLAPWTGRGVLGFAGLFVMTLPGVLYAVESCVHALHRDRVVCEGRLYCAVAPPPQAETAEPDETLAEADATPGLEPEPATEGGRSWDRLPSLESLRAWLADGDEAERDGAASGGTSTGAPRSYAQRDGPTDGGAPTALPPSAASRRAAGAGPGRSGAAGSAGISQAPASGETAASGPNGGGSSGGAGGGAASGSGADVSNGEPGGNTPATPGGSPRPSPTSAMPSASATAPPAAPAPSGRSAAAPAGPPAASRNESLEHFPSGEKRRHGGLVLDPASGEWRRDGRWTEWAENGQKVAEGEYRQGRKEGEWREWHDNGRPRSVETFEGGEPKGRCEKWHPNGRLAYHRDELRTDDGHVLWIEDLFYDNGARQMRRHVRDGVPHGPSESWHRSREQSAVGAFRHGQKDGVWLYWDEDGAELGREIWLAGKLQGRPVVPEAGTTR